MATAAKSNRWFEFFRGATIGRILIGMILFGAWVGVAQARPDEIAKVLPQFLDRNGHHALSPSLYERDAYQFQLRQHPENCSGIRFSIHWKAHRAGDYQLRLELRGVRQNQATTKVIVQTVRRHGWFRQWTYLPLTGEDFLNLGELSAWRATLWNGEQQIAEHRSFLW